MKLELFSCSGGMAEGFRRAGIVFDLMFDYDTDACNSYAANHGHRPIQMDVRDLVRMARAGWRPGAVDLLVADPPCTPWSRAGKRLGTADERDMLEETAELIQLLRPRAYLIGNVPGLQDSSSWGVVQRVIGGLSKFGYCVADYVSLDAADYGVPQHRIRPFWFGHLAGPCVRWPSPTHCDPKHPQLPGMEMPSWVTCREALQHLALEQLGRPVRMKVREASGKDGSDRSRCSRPGEAARTVVVAQGRKGGQIIINDRHAPAALDAPARTIGAKDRGQSTVLRADNPNLPPQAPSAPSRSITTQAGDTHLLEWPWDRPSTTVFEDPRLMPPGHHAGSNLSQPNAVVLSEKAAAILQGFPESWTFSGATKKARWAQIGMAMPPALAEAVARAIVEQMAAVDERSAAHASR